MVLTEEVSGTWDRQRGQGSAPPSHCTPTGEPVGEVVMCNTSEAGTALRMCGSLTTPRAGERREVRHEMHATQHASQWTVAIAAVPAASEEGALQRDRRRVSGVGRAWRPKGWVHRLGIFENDRRRIRQQSDG